MGSNLKGITNDAGLTFETAFLYTLGSIALSIVIGILIFMWFRFRQKSEERKILDVHTKFQSPLNRKTK
jgi:hypothetical protein